MRTLAIIPARGGSKRIPRKNIIPFLGKPIIQYSIETAIKSNLFNEIMVSTDDIEISEISVNAGAVVPFLRSHKTANDTAHIAEVVDEVLTTYKQAGKEFDVFCVIFPTAPFTNQGRLLEGFELLNNGKFDSVFPVLQYSYPIQRSLKIENGKISMIWPENLNKRSQDLSPSYHDSGQFYWMKTDAFNIQKKLFSDNSGAIVLSELEAHDIDTLEDWKVAEMKYKLLFQ
ncbi:MAG: pseudaminic acid cytidylyltransferase [Bacteroidia bacterium]|nr:pseudaminic acid cytidylyltransferase [Bacteroidia bacterium]